MVKCLPLKGWASLNQGIYIFGVAVDHDTNAWSFEEYNRWNPALGSVEGMSSLN
jgi:hypothetical protein